MAQHASPPVVEANGAGVLRLRNHLFEALELADSLALPPEVGARIQEILDLIEDRIASGRAK